MVESSGCTDAPVLFQNVGAHIAVICLNRPDARNAINAQMAALIESFVARAEDDPDIRVGIIAAQGSSFCAGADLKEVAAGRGSALSRPGTGFAGFVFAERRKPWIAAVQGAAHGGGTEIALACDMIVAGETATLGLTEVKRGLIAGAGGCFRLARALPRAIALEMIATGVPVDARRAFALGLVNRLAAAGEERSVAIEMAELIAANSPLSVRESLRVARAAIDLLDGDIRAIQDSAIAAVIGGPDMIEGATAFVERRAPVWTS